MKNELTPEEIVDYSVRKYKRTYQALGGHWFWKPYLEFRVRISKALEDPDLEFLSIFVRNRREGDKNAKSIKNTRVI